jgi:hypothetical protein
MTSRPCHARRRSLTLASRRTNLYAHVVKRLSPRKVWSFARIATMASAVAWTARSSSSPRDTWLMAPRRRQSSKCAPRSSSSCRRVSASSRRGPELVRAATQSPDSWLSTRRHLRGLDSRGQERRRALKTSVAARRSAAVRLTLRGASPIHASRSERLLPLPTLVSLCTSPNRLGLGRRIARKMGAC